MIQPDYSNWLLFSAMIESVLSFMGVWWDPMRVDYAIRTVNTWYKGDGLYGDGPAFHWDYYNSFVIQPMLLQILETISKSSSVWSPFSLRRCCMRGAMLPFRNVSLVLTETSRPSGARFVIALAPFTFSPR